MECMDMLTRWGADPCSADATGHLPIRYATSHGHLRAVQYFIQKAVPLGPYKVQGEMVHVSNPLSSALNHQHLNIAKLLLIAGCNPLPLYAWLNNIPEECT